jgi:hypothetical protein
MKYLKPIIFLLIIFGVTECRNTSNMKEVINLIPDVTNPSPDYWCTWGAQNYATDTTSVKHTLALGGHSVTAGYLTEKNLFGENGWSKAFPEKLRQDMILLFDLGWDVPAGLRFENSNWDLGSLLVAEDKFPSCTGSAEERLKKLNEMVMADGWKGTGLWLPCHPHGDRKNGVVMAYKDIEAYYKEGLLASKNAGIKYWKIDYGFRSGDLKFREMITRMVNQYAPDMYVEHSRGGGPLNDEECPWDTKNYHEIGSYRTWDDGRVLQQAIDVAKITHVFRTYDITQQLSIPTTLDRVAQILLELSGTGEKVIINCEDEPYIGAVLGCALGILRHTDNLEIPGYNYDPLGFKHRTDEVVRAVRWHRIAPATGAGLTKNVLDTIMLRDSWKFQDGDAWATWVTGREVIQIAPARVARGMSLPEVKCDGEPPFVICSGFPNGAIAIGTLPRISAAKKIYYPLADVTLHTGSKNNLIGIFGRFKSLIIIHDLPDIKIDKVYGQDLAGDSAIEITSMILKQTGQIIIPGEIIDRIGLSAASEADLSEPGMVIKIIYHNQ